MLFCLAFGDLKGIHRDLARQPVISAKCLLAVAAVAEGCSRIIRRVQVYRIFNRPAVARSGQMHFGAAVLER